MTLQPKLQTQLKTDTADVVVYYFHNNDNTNINNKNIEPLTSRQNLREKMRQAGRYYGVIKRPNQSLLSNLHFKPKFKLSSPRQHA
jgi:hypothetical protein